MARRLCDTENRNLDDEVDLPQKRYYRQRAHANPLSDHSFNDPVRPSDYNWINHYPTLADDSSNSIQFVDIGCGYGGLLGRQLRKLHVLLSDPLDFVENTFQMEQVKYVNFEDLELAPMFPNTLMLGMEIRVKVADYVRDKITALRKAHPGLYNNISVIRTNAMKFLPNYFCKQQKKHKWRIINSTLLAEYAYVLKPQGLVYTITDVIAMNQWMVEHLTAHPLFERVSQEELEKDPIVPKLYQSTEEGKKVYRNKAKGENHGDGDVRVAVFRRLPDPS
eukprot:gene5840-9043_t